MSKMKLIFGLLGATAAGLILGMMLAPEKGADLRKRVSKTTDDCLKDVSNWIGKGREIVEEVTDLASKKKTEPKNNNVLQE